ncbi:GDYXXLXY domain-containing protein [Shewanella psychrotolerans]|uniref:GDYXXLXY domain-containing protein n=1 Tax=Shewanella psychrotolerans TaxID=2864206 RepID=UPI001C65F691|nr:GDYXXLXY domain-containing protein [Shewanella psychrotolerans]QYJ99833.1 GDYXXLXY domain-containing protein [Shewanella psychrotolerans]
MTSINRAKWNIALVAVLSASLLILVNWDIFTREAWLAKGDVVRLKLAPVDPRSLMQGDYMTLNYEIMAPIRSSTTEQNLDAYVRVKRDPDLVAQYIGVETRYLDSTALAENELLLQVRVRGGQVKLATNAYFFEEGKGKHFAAAKYGEFRVNHKGELLLDALLDQYLQKL